MKGQSQAPIVLKLIGKPGSILSTEFFVKSIDSKKRFIFKVRTTNPSDYTVRPCIGLIDGGETCEIIVTTSWVYTEDNQKEQHSVSKHRFQVQFLPIGEDYAITEKSPAALNIIFSEVQKESKVLETKLSVQLSPNGEEERIVIDETKLKESFSMQRVSGTSSSSRFERVNIDPKYSNGQLQPSLSYRENGGEGESFKASSESIKDVPSGGPKPPAPGRANGERSNDDGAVNKSEPGRNDGFSKAQRQPQGTAVCQVQRNANSLSSSCNEDFGGEGKESTYDGDDENNERGSVAGLGERKRKAGGAESDALSGEHPPGAVDDAASNAQQRQTSLNLKSCQKPLNNNKEGITFGLTLGLLLIIAFIAGYISGFKNSN